MRILVTGGAGFIGSNLVRFLLASDPATEVTVLDKLTYAGNPDNLRDVAAEAMSVRRPRGRVDGSSRQRGPRPQSADRPAPPRYRFVLGDICDPRAVADAMEGCAAVINAAAETHVDRSLLEPGSFIQTDVYGTYVLLEEARQRGIERFIQVSTDEVYGSIAEGAFRETDRLTPSSPYSASKAGGEMMVRAYQVTYGLPIVITRGSNTFGPNQYPEKLIPLFITNALEDQPLPVYGDGRQIRDWLYVRDHCAGIACALRHGTPGEVYNIGGGNERTNIEITHRILALLDKPETLIRHVEDRPGHDRRYAIDCARLQELGWRPQASFEEALAETVRWYQENRRWWERIKSGEYREYYEKMYGSRLSMRR